MKLLQNFDDEQFVSLIHENDSFLMWFIFEGHHYVCNRHFSIRISVKEAEENEAGWPFIAFLENSFVKKPTDGKALLMQYGNVTDFEGVKTITSIVSQHKAKSKTAGTVTTFILARGIQRCRWAKFKDFNMFLQDKYISLLIDPEDEPIYADGPESAAYFHDGDFLLLPFRFSPGGNEAAAKEMTEFEAIMADLNEKPERERP